MVAAFRPARPPGVGWKVSGSARRRGGGREGELGQEVVAEGATACCLKATLASVKRWSQSMRFVGFADEDGREGEDGTELAEWVLTNGPISTVTLPPRGGGSHESDFAAERA